MFDQSLGLILVVLCPDVGPVSFDALERCEVENGSVELEKAVRSVGAANTFDSKGSEVAWVFGKVGG
jgi:hypothetical protein